MKGSKKTKSVSRAIGSDSTRRTGRGSWGPRGESLLKAGSVNLRSSLASDPDLLQLKIQLSQCTGIGANLLRTDTMKDDLAPEDLMGFAVPVSPAHSLRLLNDYMRTDLLLSIHRHIRQRIDQKKRGSPLHHLAKSLAYVIGAYDGVNLFECVARNQYHINPDDELQPERDYQHDIRLMKHHLKCHRKTIRELGHWR